MRSILASLFLALLLLAPGCAEYMDQIDDDDAGDDDAGDDDGISDPMLSIDATLLGASSAPTAIPEGYPEIEVSVELTMTNDWFDEIEAVEIDQATLLVEATGEPVVDLALTAGGWDGVVLSGETVTETFTGTLEMTAPPEGGYPCGEDVLVTMRVTYVGGMNEGVSSSTVPFGCDVDS